MVRIHPLLSNGGRGVGGVATATLVVRSQLGPNRDARNTIEPRRRVESVDNNRDNRSLHNDNHGRMHRHDSDDDRECSWSPNQWGPRAFGRAIRDAMFPSRFRAPTNVLRYDGDTNPSIWLEDYRLACHAGGATDDSARTWLEHLPRDKIND
jgi:hypothetical protein